MRRFVATLITATAFVAPLTLPASAATAPKAGQLCKAAEVGKTQNGVKCTKDGTRFRWTGRATATTKAATTTKAPTTTKAATTAKTPTTKASTATTKATTNTKVTGTTKKPSTASGAGRGVAVKGRFCAKADNGRKESDSKGRKLTCKADAAGKNRWQE